MPWSPLDEASLKLWLDCDVDRWQDAGATVPAIAASAAMALWRDQSGIGNHATQATSADRPLLGLNVNNGKAAPLFNGDTFVTPAMLDSSYNSALTYIGVAKYTGTGRQVLSSFGLSFLPSQTQTTADFYINATGTFYTIPKSVTETVGIFVVRWNGTTLRLRWNGREVSHTVSASLGLTTAQPITIGTFGLDPVGSKWQGWQLEMMLANAVWSDGSIDSAEAYLARKHDLDGPRAIFDGNSLVFGDGASTEHDYPTRAVANLAQTGRSWDFRNFGVVGQTTAQMFADAATQVDILYSPLRSRNVYVPWEDTNALFFGATAAQAIADMKAGCQARKAVGWEVRPLTPIKRNSVGQPGTFEADRLTIVADRINPANNPTYWDDPIDVSADARLSPTTDLFYFQSDQTHLTDPGYEVPAELVAIALIEEEVVPPGPTTPVLSVVDNSDGTATATITGSSVGSANIVWTQSIGSGTWVNSGSRSGDGNVTLTLAAGRYYVYVGSALNDQSANSIVHILLMVDLDSLPQSLDHSPAQIVAQLLVDLAVAVTPGAGVSTDWQARYAKEADTPDNVITVYDVPGELEGSTLEGEVQEHYGIQIRVRGKSHAVGWPKINELMMTIDQTVLFDTVTIDSTQYVVECLTRRSGIFSLGSEMADRGGQGVVSKRNVYTMNAVVSLRKTT